MPSEPRPMPELSPLPLEPWLNALSATLTALLFAVTLAFWSRLPERVPTHFGMSGQADGWGHRNMVWLLPVLALVFHVGMGFLAKAPHIYNYPRRVTPENAARLYHLGRGMMLWLRLEVVAIFAVIGWLSLRAAIESRMGVGAWTIWVILAVVYGTLIYFLVAMLAAGRKSSG